MALRIEGQQPARSWCQQASSTVSSLATTVSTTAQKVFSCCGYYACYPFKKLVATGVLPATILHEGNEWFRLMREAFLDIPDHGQEKTIVMGNHVELKGFTYTPPSHDGPKRHIVFFGGNGTTAESLIRICKKLATELKASVTCMSYPGCGLSKGEVLGDEDLLAYGRVVIDDVRSKCDNNTQLIVHGHSLGGALATVLTKEYREKGVNFYLVNDRSFTMLPEVIENLLPCILRTAASILVQLAGFCLNAKAAAANLHGRVLVLSAANDEIIKGSSKFIHSFYAPPPADITTYNLPDTYDHNTPFYPPNIYQAYNAFLGHDV